MGCGQVIDRSISAPTGYWVLIIGTFSANEEELLAGGDVKSSYWEPRKQTRYFVCCRCYRPGQVCAEETILSGSTRVDQSVETNGSQPGRKAVAVCRTAKASVSTEKFAVQQATDEPQGWDTQACGWGMRLWPGSWIVVGVSSTLYPHFLLWPFPRCTIW